MVDDKERPGESQGDTPERTPETGSGEGVSPSAVNEAAGVEDAPVAAAPEELPVAEAGPGPETAEPSSAAEPDVEAQPELPSSPPPPPPPPVRRRTPWGAMLLSGIIGGAVVAGAAAYGYLYYLPNDNSAVNVLFARLGAVELTLRDLQAAQQTAPAPTAGKTEDAAGSSPPSGAAPGAAGTPQPAAGVTKETVTELADRLAKVEAAVSAATAKIESAPVPDASKPAGLVSPPPAEQATAMKALSDDVAGLSKRMEETAAALQQARESAAAAMKAAEAKPSEPPGIGKAEFEGLGERVAGLQRGMATLQQDVQRQAAKATQEDSGVRLAVVAAGLRGAVERGAPFASELDAAKALKADPQAVALLTPFAATGVPSAAALGKEIAALAPSLAKRSGDEANKSYWQRLQSEAEKLVSVRPINSAPGNNPAAAAARIEALGKKGDIAGALAELQKLPEAVRAPAEPWIKKAQAREAAIAAAQRIEAAAIAALANHP